MSIDFTLAQVYCAYCKRGDYYVFSRNITHNLINMWKEANVYEALYHSNGKKAVTIIETLERGVEAMRHDPLRFKKHDSSNGWGVYEHAVPWLEAVLAACKENPNSTVLTYVKE